jgi:hypothetical protein
VDSALHPGWAARIGSYLLFVYLLKEGYLALFPQAFIWVSIASLGLTLKGGAGRDDDRGLRSVCLWKDLQGGVCAWLSAF